ncbi:arachidonate 12-lipoxygenase, 12R-type-like [Diretmus argenteus]
MAEYKVEVTTGNLPNAGTTDYIFITLIGSKGTSERKELDNYGIDFAAGSTGTYKVKSSRSLGKLLLVKLEKDPFFFIDEDQWFCSKMGGICFWDATHQRKAELRLKGLAGSPDPWESFEAIKETFTFIETALSGYVAEHWHEDEFYGYQFMNGSNPTLIERCTKLPSNFPVTEEMVKPFLKEGTTLAKEIEAGNIFIVDYKKWDGIKTREYNGSHLPWTTGLCLLYANPSQRLMPIAIQLFQQPSETNPIFLPSDEFDWMLAKMYLRNMLVPHFRYNLRINMMARGRLLGEGGGLTNSTMGNDGLSEIMRRGLETMTYTNLCLPDCIAARGLESVPGNYYRDDGLKLWDMTNSYVKGIVEYYYPSDDDVRKDSEVQAWVNEIFMHSFLAKKELGIPSSLGTVAELVKFVTMVIFRATGQHAAVNNGQYDYNSFTANSPALMRKPPPTVKGKSTMKTVFDTLPTKGESVKFMIMAWMLSDKYSDTILLGDFPAERFDEETPKKLMADFKAKLTELIGIVTERNKQLAAPYNYLNPAQIESSITI